MMRGGGVQAQLIGLVDSKELHARLIQVNKLGSKHSAHLWPQGIVGGGELRVAGA